MVIEPTLADDIADIKAGVSGGMDVPEPPAPAGEPQELSAAPATESPAPLNAAPPEQDYQEQSFEEPVEQPFDQPQELSGPSQQAIDKDYIHEVVESIIEEKWTEFVAKTGEFTSWKDKTSTDLVATKQEVLRLRESFEKLQHLMLGKTKEYGESMRDVHSEMKALEKVFERILEPLTTNIKDLQRLTDDLKRR